MNTSRPTASPAWRPPAVWSHRQRRTCSRWIDSCLLRMASASGKYLALDAKREGIPVLNGQLDDVEHPLWDIKKLHPHLLLRLFQSFGNNYASWMISACYKVQITQTCTKTQASWTHCTPLHSGGWFRSSTCGKTRLTFLRFAASSQARPRLVTKASVRVVLYKAGQHDVDPIRPWD